MRPASTTGPVPLPAAAAAPAARHRAAGRGARSPARRSRTGSRRTPGRSGCRIPRAGPPHRREPRVLRGSRSSPVIAHRSSATVMSRVSSSASTSVAIAWSPSQQAGHQQVARGGGLEQVAPRRVQYRHRVGERHELGVRQVPGRTCPVLRAFHHVEAEPGPGGEDPPGPRGSRSEPPRARPLTAPPPAACPLRG